MTAADWTRHQPGEILDRLLRWTETELAYRDTYGASSGPTQRIIAPVARDTTMRLTPADGD